MKGFDTGRRILFKSWTHCLPESCRHRSSPDEIPVRGKIRKCQKAPDAETNFFEILFDRNWTKTDFCVGWESIWVKRISKNRNRKCTEILSIDVRRCFKFLFLFSCYVFKNKPVEAKSGLKIENVWSSGGLSPSWKIFSRSFESESRLPDRKQTRDNILPKSIEPRTVVSGDDSATFRGSTLKSGRLSCQWN